MALIAMLAAAPAGGGYANPFKILTILIVLLVWAKLLTWADKDAPIAHLPREAINTGMIAGMGVGYALFFFLPNFAIAILALIFVFAIEVGAYLFIRNQKVGLGDLKGEIKNIGKGMKKGEKVVKEVVGEVQFMNKSGALLPAPAAETPEAAVYSAIQQLFADPLKKGAEMLELIPADGMLAAAYTVDGFRYRGSSADREIGSEVVSYFKAQAGMDVADKRKPQTGSMKVVCAGKRLDIRVSTRGSTAGETMTLEVEPKKRHDLKLDQLGLFDEQLELLKETVSGTSGIVLVSAPKGAGLTSLMYAILRGHDAFLTHIHTIEREARADLEGITQNKLAPTATGAEEAKLVSWVIDQEPDTIAMTSLEDSKTAHQLIKFAKKGKRVYVGMRVGSTQEALNQWRKLVGDDNLAMDALILAISGRTLRLLCNACKVGYTPDPMTLRKLNMDSDRVSKLYQARSKPILDPKGQPLLCEFCHELHFKGRTGIYELFMMDEDAKKAILAGGSATQLKMAFRKQRAKYLQEQALLLVEKGDTSVQEVLRVLKPEGSGDAPPPPPPPPAAPKSSARPAGPASKPKRP